MPVITRWIGSVSDRDPAAPRNDAVRAAMEQIAKADSVRARGEYYVALLNSRLLAVKAGPAPQKSLEMITGPAEPFEFQTFASPLGPNAVALYTDIDALVAKNPQAQAFAAFEARPLFDAIQQSPGGALINFGSPRFSHLQQSDIQQLARGKIPAPGRRIELTKPALALRPETLDMLRAALADDPRIESAHFFGVSIAGQPPRHSCGVKFTPATQRSDADLAMRKLISRVARLVTDGGNFDFVLIDAAGPFSRAETMFPPFYTRAAS